MRYPVQDEAEWASFGRLSFAERLAVVWRNARYRRRSRRWKPVDLHAATLSQTPIGDEDIVLLCVVKNAEKYLPSFLHHYRKLGVRRFAFVDDASTDATGAILASQPDVDLFRSNADFRRAAGGLLWRDMLVGRYGRNRWYLSIDCDEYLVFPGSQSRRLTDFVGDLEAAGLRRAFALMLDIYPDPTDGRSAEDAPSDASPTSACPLYDGDGYWVDEGKFCTSIWGGPRHRLFGATMRLTKFPLVYADAALRFTGGSHHGPLPITRNFGAPNAILLHYKFPSGWSSDFRQIAERGSHFGGSVYYKQIVDHENFSDRVDFRTGHSKRFEGSDKLVAEGFMQDLRR